MRRPLPAPWTAADETIAFRNGRGYWAATLRGVSLLSDVRDAELMLGAQLQPRCVVHWRNGLDHLILLRGPPTGERLEWLD